MSQIQKVALVGATGFIGEYLLSELVSRQHQVTALVRQPEKVPSLPGVTAKALEVKDLPALTQALQNHDVAVLAFHYLNTDFAALIAAIKASGVSRLVVVGGAASLEVAPGVELLSSPDFPAEWKAPAEAARDFLITLRGERELNWTYLSPSAFIEPGERTGKFRLGGDQLLVNEQGESRISNQDFAVALVDEIEHPQHPQKRFTVGY